MYEKSSRYQGKYRYSRVIITSGYCSIQVNWGDCSGSMSEGRGRWTMPTLSDRGPNPGQTAARITRKTMTPSTPRVWNPLQWWGLQPPFTIAQEQSLD